MQKTMYIPKNKVKIFTQFLRIAKKRNIGVMSLILDKAGEKLEEEKQEEKIASNA